MSRCVRWTPELLAEAVARHESGETFASLAKHYDISIGSMQKVIKNREWVRQDSVSRINVDELRKLWAEGHAASEIARRMGGGVTKNMVIGKAHRLNLAAQSSPIKRLAPGEIRKPREARRKPLADGQKVLRSRGAGAVKGPTLPPLPRPNRVTPVARQHQPGTTARMPLTGVTLPPLELIAVEVPTVRFVGRISECTYIVSGERRSSVYCDKATLPGKTMCADHHAKCFVQPSRVSVDEQHRRAA